MFYFASYLRPIICMNILYAFSLVETNVLILSVSSLRIKMSSAWML